MATRFKLLEQHNNDYGFNPLDFLIEEKTIAYWPTLSVVIPYYETGEIFEATLLSLNHATEHYLGNTEIIIIDDGSIKKPLVNHLKTKNSRIKQIVMSENVGRTEARNRGLEMATGELAVFLDSDIIIDDQMLINHAKLQLEALKKNKKAIIVSFFEFTDKNDKRIFDNNITASNLHLNDFRLKCTYESTWIGCEEDKKFIGQHIKLVEETNYFRDWHGQYKAWVLPNMILGGAFSVWRSEILEIGKFDIRFKGYGFTETSAITRLVAERDNVVIPCMIGGGLHINDDNVNISREEKDKLFKEKHAFYFDVFLMEEA